MVGKKTCDGQGSTRYAHVTQSPKLGKEQMEIPHTMIQEPINGRS